MKKTIFLIAIVLIMTVTAYIMVTAIASASTEKKASEHSTIKKSEEVKNSEHGKEKTGHGTEEESAWRITGWQTIFAILAIGFYITISLKLLPKIAAKDLEEEQ